MIIDIAGIPAGGTTFTGEEPSAILDVGNENDFRIDGPICYDLAAQLISGELIVKGELTVEVLLRCSRCGEFFHRTLSEPSFESVREVGGRVDSVDLTEDMREAIILAFPNHPLCRSDCRGLCSQCGINLNTGNCECKQAADSRLGVLDIFFNKL